MKQEPPLRFFDTLSRTAQELVPVEPGRVSIYTCGPTVYRYAHIGNLRSYLMADWLRRLLEAHGYRVNHVKNITDVGHMRQDMLERGQDKVLAAALAEGKTPEQIAQHYTAAFLRDEAKLNILPAHELPKATDNVGEMVALADELVSKGFAYEMEGNVYFEVSKFRDYGKLSRQQAEGLEEGVRVDADPLKRDQRDFALWKAAEPGRALKWPSPWGEGFPGWHVECSAMAAKYLGPEIDFHTGGVDNIFPHHEDEIAQSEAAFGQRHVRTWMHGEHLLVDGLKMAKSTGNTYLISDLERRGFDPLAFRYLCATARYHTRLNFTFASLRAAQRGLVRLRRALHEPGGKGSKKATAEGERLREQFWNAACSDLNLPRALAVAWRVARSRLSTPVKRELLMDFDRLIGLDLVAPPVKAVIPADVTILAEQRQELRRRKVYDEADAIRDRIRSMGFEVQDGHKGSALLPVHSWEAGGDKISSSADVPSLIHEPTTAEFTVGIVAHRGLDELRRCLEAARHWGQIASTEIIVVDNGFEEDDAQTVDEAGATDERVRTFHTDHFLGAAAGRNIVLKQARGRVVVLLDTSVELKGDLFSSLRNILDDPRVGLAGKWGATTEDLRSFDEAGSSGEVDAVEAYLLAFRREVLPEVGFLDEKYRFYRHLDLDFSLAVRSAGYRAVIDTELPVARHEHVEWTLTPPEDRERLSKRNYYRFLRKWGKRNDLLVAQAG
jgi:cysteinyl-tRNA synthetase